MLRITRVLVLAIVPLTLMAARTASAEEIPRAGRVDGRVQTVNYRPGQVYRIRARFQQETLIVFHPEESIVHVGIGDPLAWQAEPVSRFLMLKPLLEKADTNMNVITQRVGTKEVRAYAFELDALEPGQAGNTRGTWQLTFRYPEEEQQARLQALQQIAQQKRVEVSTSRRTRTAQGRHNSQPQRAGDWNMAYAYSGAGALAPHQVMDDGVFTYFQFDVAHTLPAIFIVNADGTETLVNWHVDGRYVVVQRTASEFLLRLGELTTRIYNEVGDG